MSAHGRQGAPLPHTCTGACRITGPPVCGVQERMDRVTGYESGKAQAWTGPCMPGPGLKA